MTIKWEPASQDEMDRREPKPLATKKPSTKKPSTKKG